MGSYPADPGRQGEAVKLFQYYAINFAMILTVDDRKKGILFEALRCVL
jgi:hypothetical protein